MLTLEPCSLAAAFVESGNRQGPGGHAQYLPRLPSMYACWTLEGQGLFSFCCPLLYVIARTKQVLLAYV